MDGNEVTRVMRPGAQGPAEPFSTESAAQADRQTAARSAQLTAQQRSLLTSCRACGHMMSKRSMACPQCGHPAPGVQTPAEWEDEQFAFGRQFCIFMGCVLLGLLILAVLTN